MGSVRQVVIDVLDQHARRTDPNHPAWPKCRCGFDPEGDDQTWAEHVAKYLMETVAPEVERLTVDSRLLGQANYLLAKVVAAANLGAIDGDDGFIQSYNLPVGPIHNAIPFLNEQGIVVTNDGRICSGNPT